MLDSSETTRQGTTEPIAPLERTTPGLHGRHLERIGDGIHRVLHGGEVCGFIEEVGSIFVSLSGTSYDRAVEIHQSLTLERAVLVFSVRG